MVHLSLSGCSCSDAMYRSCTACSITQGSPSTDFISSIRPRTRRITPGPHDANLVTLKMSALVLLETTVVRVSSPISSRRRLCAGGDSLRAEWLTWRRGRRGRSWLNSGWWLVIRLGIVGGLVGYAIRRGWMWWKRPATGAGGGDEGAAWGSAHHRRC